MAATSRSWFFTANNCREGWSTKEWEDHFSEWNEGRKIKMTWLHMQEEKKSTQHWQGVCGFAKPVKLTAVQKFFGKKIHVEKQRSDEAIKYVLKEDTRIGDQVIIGDVEKLGQGKRTDLANACDAIKEGGIMKVVREHPTVYVKYHRGLEKLEQKLQEQEMRDMECYIYWGPSGSGKTHAVYERFKIKNVYNMPDPSDKWFDNYNGQDVLLLDECDKFLPKIQYLLKWMDKYPLEVPVKGGHVQAKWTKVVLVGNKHPDEWYPVASAEAWKGVQRRVKEIEEFKARE